MYFDRFIALGNNNREINDMVLKFDVSITVPEYVYLTKAEIMAKGRQEYNEFSECVKAYETDPISALERYGPNAKKYYSAKNTTICCKDRDMEKYYQLYIHDYCFCDKIDSEGSVLSCCNPDAKWDSCSCEAKGNLRDIYAEAERRRRIYVPDKDRLTWDIVVNHNRNKLTDEEYTNKKNIYQRRRIMKYTDMLKINPKSEVSSSTSTNNNNIIHPDTTFSAKDILVQYEDVAEELSDKAKPEKKGQHSKKGSDEEKDYDIFTMKMYGDEKPRLEALSKAANTDMSSFARKRIFSDERIIILDKASYISRYLIEISDTLRTTKLEGPDSSELLKKIFAKLCEIGNVHVAICKELTVFKEATGEEET